MKKILIISFHSLPMNVIASYRAMAFLYNLKKFGFEPTLLTHHWDNDLDEVKIKKEKYNYGTIIRIPIVKHWFHEVIGVIESIPLINRFSILFRWLSGVLDSSRLDWDSYRSLKIFCKQHLSDYTYDLIMGIYSPHHHLKLCYELHTLFSIPYILDFRDLWNNRVIHRHYSPNLSESLQDSITKFYWKKWLSKAKLFSITSKPWMEKIHEFSKTNGIIVHNGYEQEFFDRIDVKPPKTTEFVVLHAGSLYTHQYLDIFFQGCKQFVERNRPKNFKVKFIGADRRHYFNQLSGLMPRAKDYVLSNLDEAYCEVTKRIPKEEVIDQMAKCHLFLFPSFPDSPGTYGGKIFECIGGKRNILVIPDDLGVVGELIRETKAGFMANTPGEVTDYLQTCYEEWQENGYVDYKADFSIIQHYSRENQVRAFSDHLKLDWGDR